MEMTRALGGAAMLLALAGACSAAESAAPRAVSASYEVFRNGGHVGLITETFEAKGGSYRIVSETQAVGFLALFQRHPLRLVSSGQLAASGLRPQRFEGKRGDSDPRQVLAEFDWQAGQLRLVHDDRNEILPLPPATQDRLSAMYQFMFLAPDRSRRFGISMTTGRKLDQYLYAVTPGVEIETPLGRMSTVHLVKQHRADESGTEIWLAPQYRFFPVKMLILEEDGTRYEQLITRLELVP